MKVSKSKDGLGINEDLTIWSHGSDNQMMTVEDGNKNG